MSALFDGLTFFVYRLAPEHGTKEEVQALIEQAGGAFIQRIPEASEGRRVVASSLDGAELSRAGARAVDILSVQWVIDCVKQGTLVPRTASYYLQVVEDGTEQSTEFDLEAELQSHLKQQDEAKMAAEDGWDFLRQRETDEDVKPDLTTVKLELPKLSTRFHSVADPRFTIPRDRGADSDDSEPETEAEGEEVRLVELNDEDDTDTDGDEPDGDLAMPDASAQSTGSVNDKLEQVRLESHSPRKRASTSGLSGASPGMGDEGAGTGVKDEFSDERAWGPLVMYFDSEENAAKNALVVEANEDLSVVKQRDKKLAQAEKRGFIRLLFRLDARWVLTRHPLASCRRLARHRGLLDHQPARPKPEPHHRLAKPPGPVCPACSIDEEAKAEEAGWLDVVSLSPCLSSSGTSWLAAISSQG